MAEKSEQEIRQIVERVMTEVRGETERHEAEVFGVGDLQRHLTGLAGIGVGDVQAWKISYDTSGVSVERGAARRVGDVQAWKISYDTSGVSVERGVGEFE